MSGPSSGSCNVMPETGQQPDPAGLPWRKPMEVIAPFADMLSAIMDQWALGIEMLGQHAVWLWVLPPVWGIAACMILDPA